LSIFILGKSRVQCVYQLDGFIEDQVEKLGDCVNLGIEFS